MQVTHVSRLAPRDSKRSRFDPLGNATAADMKAKRIKNLIFGETVRICPQDCTQLKYLSKMFSKTVILKLFCYLFTC